MAVNKTKQITNLDFDAIRSNFQSFLESQEQFKDFDFNGSGLSVLLDVLAYNTHYQSFYTNMVANEMFMDSAVKKESVMSHAKQIGYTPHSKKAAEARVTVSLSTSDTSSKIIPARTKFSATLSGTSYSFYNMSPITIDTSGTAPFVSSEFSIFEGAFNSVSYVNSSTSETKFVIPTLEVDTDHITVRVLSSTTDSNGKNDVWTKVSDITALTSTSTSFFLEVTSEGFYEIKFGDGILGKKLEDGNVVIIDYFTTTGSAANGVGKTDTAANRTFTASIENGTVLVASSAAGGAAIETKSSIRFNSPLFFQTQNRAVTENDYRSLVLNEYGDADDVFVYGGEEIYPPEYGRVYIAVKPKTTTTLTDQEKDDIKNNILKPKNIVGILPEIIDPEYTYVMFKAKSAYDPTMTTKTALELKALLISYITLYATTELCKFGKHLYINQLEALCRNLENSLLYVDVDVMLQKRLAPTLNVKRNYVLEYNNTLVNTSHDSIGGLQGFPSVQSSEFAYKKPDGTIFRAAIDSDMNGKLRIYEIVGGRRVTIYKNMGSIDFASGAVFVNNFIPVSATAQGLITFDVTPREDVIFAPTHKILHYDTIQDGNLTVEVSNINDIELSQIELSRSAVSPPAAQNFEYDSGGGEIYVEPDPDPVDGTDDGTGITGGEGSTGDPIDPTGACCIGENCSIRTEANCLALGGIYHGDNSTCEQFPCEDDPPVEERTGACCIEGLGCSVTTEAQCRLFGGEYQGDGTDCTTVDCVGDPPDDPECPDGSVFCPTLGTCLDIIIPCPDDDR